MKRILTNTIGHVMLFGFFFGIIACDEATMSKAQGQVSNFKVDADFGIVNDEPEAGYSVTFDVKNIGEMGVIKVIPRLSCSEGEWTREQNLTLQAGEQRTLTYFFHEPTISSTNVQGTVKVKP